MSVDVGPVGDEEELQELPKQKATVSKLGKQQAEEVLASLTTTEKGLTGAEADERREQFGFNTLPKKKSSSPVLLN
jgi:hypothetical protein